MQCLPKASVVLTGVRSSGTSIAILALWTLLSISCSGSEPGAPNPVNQFVLRVQMTDGVTGSPAIGRSQFAERSTVSYQFAPIAGYQDLEVRVDGKLVAASGTLTMDQQHELAISAFPTPPASATPEMITMQGIYSTQSSTAMRSLLRKVSSLQFSGDTVSVNKYRLAEAFVLQQLGPTGYQRAEDNLAGMTIMLAGDSVARSSEQRFALLAGPPTFPADTIVPTTIFFVNGILNTSSSALNSARGVVDLLVASGFNPATTVQQPGSARQAASMRVFLHINPMVSLQNPLAECVSTLGWAFTVANGVTKDGSGPSIWLRVKALVDKVNRVTSVCTDPSVLSTNARVLDQYLGANASLLVPPDANDRELTSLIEQERSFAGGRNVWVIGHSQGAVIARTAVGLVGSGGANIGCVAGLAVASPLSNTLVWPQSDFREAVIQKGAIDGSADILYSLSNESSSRTDGSPSYQTEQLDQDIKNNEVTWLFVRRLQLHSFVDGYLSPGGQRNALIAKIRRIYDGDGVICSGALEGVVGDIATRLPLAGAKIQPLVSNTARGNPTTTNSLGAFKTPPLLPILHDLRITAAGYDTVILGQRLVPFRSSGVAQGGMILLGRACTSAGNCQMQGNYLVSYQVTGTIGSYGVGCAFDSRLAITQHDSIFTGTISTDRYQHGCENPSGGYIFWDQGTTSMNGIQQGRNISFTHAAIPPWQMTGRTFEGGFSALEPLWKISNPQFVLRVEMTATRTSSSVSAVVVSGSGGAGRGPQFGQRK